MSSRTKSAKSPASTPAATRASKLDAKGATTKADAPKAKPRKPKIPSVRKVPAGVVNGYHAPGPSLIERSLAPKPETTIKSMCVYCGSGPGRNPAYLKAARTLGQGMAERGIGLVYGGGSLGLMGETARSVLAHGGYVTGIIPQFLSDKEKMLRDVQELHVVEDMHTRKRMMFERSDAFVALPGGIGTLEELVEQLTWAQLGRHKKPIVLVNIDGFWQPFLSLLAHMRDEAFIRAGLEVRFVTVNRAEDVVAAAEAAAGDDPTSSEVLKAITQQF
jgi:uncharacterized protein (TIGR00730 family)